MLVASIVAALIAICAAVEALDRISRFYNRRCEDSFGVKLLSEKAVAGWAGLMALVCFGDTWRRYAAAAGRDELDGALLMGVGALGGLAWLILNLRRTNIAYGVAGTALQLFFAFLPFLFAYRTGIGWFALVAWVFFALAGDEAPGPPRRPLPGERVWPGAR